MFVNNKSSEGERRLKIFQIRQRARLSYYKV